MKVLLIGGSKVSKLVDTAVERFQNSIEVEGMSDISEIDDYLNKGGTFNRVIVSEPGYLVRGEDIAVTRNKIDEFIWSIKNKCRLYSIIFVTSSEEIGAELVEATLDTIGISSIVYLDKEKGDKFTATFLLKLISTDLKMYPRRFKVLDMAFIQELENRYSDANKSVSEIEWSEEKPVENTAYVVEQPQEIELETWNELSNPEDKDKDGYINNTQNSFGNAMAGTEKDLDLKDLDFVFDDVKNSEELGWNSPEENEEGTEDWGGSTEKLEENSVELEDDPDEWGENPEENNADFDDWFDKLEAKKSLSEEELSDGEELDPNISSDESFDDWLLPDKEEIETESEVEEEREEETEPVTEDEVNNLFDMDNLVDEENEPEEFGGDSSNNNSVFSLEDSDFTDKEEGFSLEDSVFTSKDIETGDKDFDFDNFKSDFNSPVDHIDDVDIPQENETEFEDYDFNRGGFEEKSIVPIVVPVGAPKVVIKAPDINVEVGSKNKKPLLKFKGSNKKEVTDKKEGKKLMFGGKKPSINVDNLEKVEVPRVEVKKQRVETPSIEEMYREDNYNGVDTGIGIDNAKNIKGIGIKKKVGKNKNIPMSQPVKSYDILKMRLDGFKKRGNLLVVTGTDGSGKTTIATNIANMVCKLGYQVLLIDMDTSGRGIAYSNLDTYEAIHSQGNNISNLKNSINNSSEKFGRYVDIVRPGLHVLSSGLAFDLQEPSEFLNKNNISKLIHQVQAVYHFIIVDIGFKDATESFPEFVMSADNVALVAETNTHGLMQLLLEMANINDDDLDGQITDIMFNTSKIILNKEDGMRSLFGSSVASTGQLLSIIDNKLTNLIGFSIDNRFADLDVCGLLKYNRSFENYWYTRNYISDTQDGEEVFLEILKKILDIKES